MRTNRFAGGRRDRRCCLLAACSPARTARPAAGALDATVESLQLQWVPQAQFAGYYAAVEQGYYDGGGPRRRDHAAAAPRSPRRSWARSRTDRSSPSRGCPRSCRRARARPAQTWSTSPRSSSAPARSRFRGRTAASPRRRTSRARRSAPGASATSSRSLPPPGWPAWRPARTTPRVIQPFDMSLLLAAFDGCGEADTTASTSPRR